MATTVFLGYPVHSLATGPIDFSYFEQQSASLSGVYLQFAYLVALQRESAIALDFLPSGEAYGLNIGEPGALRPYAPTASREEMIAVVLRESGESVYLPKPVKMGVSGS